MRYASVALIKEKITYTVTDARNVFYTLALKNTELLFRSNLESQASSKRMAFSYLFSPSIAKYQNEELEYQVQTILDSDLPGLVDVFNLSDEMLKAFSDKSFSNDEQNDISTDSWLVDIEEIENQAPLTDLQLNMENFSKVCDKLNVLSLTPNWTTILKATIEKRLNLSTWKDNWEMSIVPAQLKWLHVLILPWLSYVMPKTEDIGNFYSRV